MKRFGPGWGWQLTSATIATRERVRHRVGIFRTPIAPELCEEPGDGGGGGGGEKDAAYWQAEAKKAFEARDTLKRQHREFEEKGLLITADQKTRLADLEKAAADAEEDRKKKAGEFESWRKEIATKHSEEVKKRDDQLTSLQREIADDKIQAAFGAATTYFGGGENSKTILTPALAFKALREHVSFEEYDFGEDDGGKRKVIVVRDAKGKIIREDGGHPAPFSEAVGRLIESLPDKDHILRGSGKTGSGARGGSGGTTGKVDFNHLTQEQMRDPKIIEEAKRRTARAGGIVMGEAFERAGAK